MNRSSVEVILGIEGLSKSFKGTPILRGINLSVHRGDVISIMGPSGSGKTTLLRCINFLEPFESGSISFLDERVSYVGPSKATVSERDLVKMRSRVGIVFQRFNLFPHRTVLGNLLEGLIHVRRLPKPDAIYRALAALERVGLAEKRDVYPSELSGGQQQRVAIARALCMDPDLILFDEVTSALDPELTQEVLKVMRELVSSGMTMIVVTHEMRFAREASNRVMFLEGGEVIAELPSDEFFSRPPTQRIREYIS